MRSLFLKIFLSFWLAMTLIGAIGILFALNSDPSRVHQHQEDRLIQRGEELLALYEEAGEDGLRQQIGKHIGQHNSKRERLLLLDQNGRSLTGERRLPRRIERMAREAQESDRPIRHRGPMGEMVIIPIDDYLLFATVPPPTRLERLLDPQRIGLRLLLTFSIAGLVCWWLAKSLTSPLRRLRRATKDIAAGNLQTRVAPDLEGGNAEIADLAVDFDHMTERVSTLLGNQQQLLRDISHELRSPLARLSVALELARQQAGDTASAPHDRIELEAERLNEMIGQLLVLTRLESQQAGEGKVPIQLDQLLTEIVDDANYEVQDVRIDLITEPMIFEGVEELLRRAFENIIRNALRHAPKGSTIDVSLEQTDSGDGMAILINVRDRGQGVPESALERLFDPFYRVEDDRSRHSGGSGIGLAITDRAIRLHRGVVRARNAEGGGLLVKIKLPHTSE